MAKFVRCRQLLRHFKQSSAPTVGEGVVTGSQWFDTDDGTYYKCTSVAPVTFEEMGGGGGGTPGGSDGDLQYNNAGSFGGITPSGNAAEYLDGTLNFSTPAGGGGSSGIPFAVGTITNDPGVSDTLTATIDPAIVAYEAGKTYLISSNDTNYTFNNFLNLNSIGNIPLYTLDGNSVSPNSLSYVAGNMIVINNTADGAVLISPAQLGSLPAYMRSGGLERYDDIGTPDNIIAQPYVDDPGQSSSTAQILRIKIGAGNSSTGGPVTLDLAPGGVPTGFDEPVKLADGTDPLADDILEGKISLFIYNGSYYQLINPAKQIRI